MLTDVRGALVKEEKYKKKLILILVCQLPNRGGLKPHKWESNQRLLGRLN
jgi:hypothetical protein